MAEKLTSGEKIYELKLGKSFDTNPDELYHTMRYDFMPASIDTSQDATLEVAEGNSVTVTVPHVEGSGTSHTVFKGNKKPCLRDCVLIIDNETGSCTLERLSYAMQVKSTRHGTKVGHAAAKQEPTGAALSSSQSAKAKPPTNPTASKPQNALPSTEAKPPAVKDYICSSLSASSSDSDSSSSDDSDEDMEVDKQTESAANFLSQDLNLSESDSD